MRYQYCPNNPERYATNLHREQGTKNLQWDNARGQDVLLIQTPFGCIGESVVEELCVLMEQTVTPANQYTEIKPSIWVRFVTAADKARMNGCPIHTEASTYSVFSCYTEGETCTIYAPQQNQAMISPYCSIPMEIHVEVREQTRTTGVFKKKTMQTGYYVLTFPKDLASGYHDGDLVCRVGGLEIPVTRQMLEQGQVYVKTELRPEIVSMNRGLELI